MIKVTDNAHLSGDESYGEKGDSIGAVHVDYRI